jgi:trans-aconitate methyltransferase
MPDERLALDALLSRLSSLRPRLLKHWISGGTELTGRRRGCFNSLARSLDDAYYSPDATTIRREEIKQLCMGRDSGVAWAKRYLEKGFPEPQTANLPMFSILQKWFASGEIRSAHQVGCCSGREIAWFARHFPEIRFLGSDCDPAVVTFLKNFWAGIRNLDFMELHMDRPIPDAPGVCTDLLYASGGFHYMDSTSLRHFFENIRKFAHRIALSQPLDRPFDAVQSEESTPRGMLSWNHPYPRLLAEAGWKGIEWREGFVAELPKWKNIAVWAYASDL